MTVNLTVLLSLILHNVMHLISEMYLISLLFGFIWNIENSVESNYHNLLFSRLFICVLFIYLFRFSFFFHNNNISTKVYTLTQILCIWKWSKTEDLSIFDERWYGASLNISSLIFHQIQQRRSYASLLTLKMPINYNNCASRRFQCISGPIYMVIDIGRKNTFFPFWEPTISNTSSSFRIKAISSAKLLKSYGHFNSFRPPFYSHAQVMLS